MSMRSAILRQGVRERDRVRAQRLRSRARETGRSRFGRVREAARGVCEARIGRSRGRVIEHCSVVGCCQGMDACQLLSGIQQRFNLAELRTESVVLITRFRGRFFRSKPRLKTIILGVECIRSDYRSLLRNGWACSGLWGILDRIPGWPRRDEKRAESTAVEAYVTWHDSRAGAALGVAVEVSVEDEWSRRGASVGSH